MVTVAIDPVTRIEGHLAVRTEVENGQVKAAYASGEMFRGFEVFLKGRHPLDAQQITQRICGVCPVSHGLASTQAQEMAYGIKPARNGRILRNLILGANYLQSHILHFYHLTALDFVDVTALTGYTGRDPVLRDLRRWIEGQTAAKVTFPAAPFLPRYEGDYIKDKDVNLGAVRHYVEALRIRALAHKAAALFAGKMPHVATLVPGGLTEKATADKIAAYGAILEEIRDFVEECYVPDLVAVAKAFPAYLKLGRSGGNFLAFGGFPESDGGDLFFPQGVLMKGALATLDVGKITEDVATSRFSSGSGLGPAAGETVPAPEKAGAYSWLKAPRYGGTPMEVGPLARMLVGYQAGKPEIKKQVDAFLGATGLTVADLDSVLGRHAARAVEALLLVERCGKWLDELKPEEPSWTEYTIPETGQGYGLLEAPRGALGHWIEIKGKVISRYQCVVPTTWNMSPRDDRGVAGPVEQSLVGTPVADPENPLEVARVIRSFDPCLACAVH
jgi:ferredoxin hydrogenase large subunit/hydrogenase large subunit